MFTKDDRLSKKQKLDHNGSLLKDKDMLFSSFEWLIHPIKKDDFIQNYFEKKPLLIKRTDSNYYGRDSTCFNIEKVFEILRSQILLYGEHLNVVKCIDGSKRYLNNEGQARIEDIRKFWTDTKASLQIFQPQKYSDELWRIVSVLEDTFGCLSGGSAYLTPPNSQALSPHYDDVEVFILQTEGRKTWKVWKSPIELPRDCSTYEPDTKPLMEIILEEGDLLYFPRGYVHVAETLDSVSTHITLSTYQRHTWFDYLQHALPSLLEKESTATRSNTKYEGMKLKREVFQKHIKSLLKRLATYTEESTSVTNCILDDVMDSSLGSEFILCRVPPPLEDRIQIHDLATNQSEAKNNNDDNENSSNNTCSSNVRINSDSKVKLLNSQWMKLIIGTSDDGDITASICHSLHNSRILHMDGRYSPEPSSIDVHPDNIGAMSMLFKNYPEFTSMKALIGAASASACTPNSVIHDCELLWMNGLLVIDTIGCFKPALSCFDDGSEGSEDEESEMSSDGEDI